MRFDPHSGIGFVLEPKLSIIASLPAARIVMRDLLNAVLVEELSSIFEVSPCCPGTRCGGSP